MDTTEMRNRQTMARSIPWERTLGGGWRWQPATMNTSLFSVQRFDTPVKPWRAIGLHGLPAFDTAHEAMDACQRWLDRHVRELLGEDEPQIHLDVDRGMAQQSRPGASNLGATERSAETVE